MSFDEYLDNRASSKIMDLESENAKISYENNRLCRIIESMTEEITSLENQVYSLSNSGVIHMDSLNVEDHKDYLVKTDSGDHYVANRKFDMWYDTYSGDEISGVIKVANLSPL